MSNNEDITMVESTSTQSLNYKGKGKASTLDYTQDENLPW